MNGKNSTAVVRVGDVPFMVAVESTDSGGLEGGLAEKLNLEEKWGIITDLATSIRNGIEETIAALAMSSSKLKPDRVEVEVGVGLTIEEGKIIALVVGGSAEASLKLTLGWEPQKDG